jgi:hypothetical protein
MIIKKSRLNTFIKEYNEKIGTDFEWEDWDDGLVHVYAFDIETDSEDRELGNLLEKYDVSEVENA